MSIDPGNLPGVNNSLDYGEATAMETERKSLESAGSPGQGASSGPTGGAPIAPQAGPAPQSAPPTQPEPPRTPLTQADMVPGGPVFMKPQLEPAPSWRQGLRTWGQHPESNVIRRLSKRADAGLQQGPPPQ